MSLLPEVHRQGLEAHVPFVLYLLVIPLMILASPCYCGQDYIATSMDFQNAGACCTKYEDMDAAGTLLENRHRKAFDFKGEDMTIFEPPAQNRRDADTALPFAQNDPIGIGTLSRRGRILIAAAIVLTALNLRLAISSLSPLLSIIGEDLGFSLTMLGLLGAMPMAAFSVVGLLAPQITARLSPESVTVATLGLLIIGELWRALSQTAEIMMCSSALALLGTALGNVSVPALIKKHFPDRISVLTTLHLVAMHLGALVPASMAVPLATAASWRASIAVWTACAIPPLLLWLAMWRPRRFRLVSRAEDVRFNRPNVWKSARAWQLALFYGFGSWNIYIALTWLPELLSSAGSPPEFGGTMVSLLIGIGLIGSIVLPTLTCRLPSSFPLTAVCTAGFAIGYIGLVISPGSVPVLWSLLIGIGTTVFTIPMTLINLQTRGAAEVTALSGMVQGVGCAVAMAGPMLFGAVRAWSGSWIPALLFVGVGSSFILIYFGWSVRRANRITGPPQENQEPVAA